MRVRERLSWAKERAAWEAEFEAPPPQPVDPPAKEPKRSARPQEEEAKAPPASAEKGRGRICKECRRRVCRCARGSRPLGGLQLVAGTPANKRKGPAPTGSRDSSTENIPDTPGSATSQRDTVRRFKEQLRKQRTGDGKRATSSPDPSEEVAPKNARRSQEAEVPKEARAEPQDAGLAGQKATKKKAKPAAKVAGNAPAEKPPAEKDQPAAEAATDAPMEEAGPVAEAPAEAPMEEAEPAGEAAAKPKKAKSEARRLAKVLRNKRWRAKKHEERRQAWLARQEQEQAAQAPSEEPAAPAPDAPESADKPEPVIQEAPKSPEADEAKEEAEPKRNLLFGNGRERITRRLSF